jgi:hypothetical protein
MFQKVALEKKSAKLALIVKISEQGSEREINTRL